MRNALIILALFTLTGCGQGFETQNNGTVDATLKPYLDTFLKYANQNGRAFETLNLDMTFSESMPPSNNGGSVIGYCQRSSGYKRVVIKISYWNSASVSDREQLVFHELGHCLLNLDHNDTVEVAPFWNNPYYQANNVPSSIMNTFHFDSGLYSGNRGEYVKRLFNANRMPLYWNAPSQFGTDEYVF